MKLTSKYLCFLGLIFIYIDSSCQETTCKQSEKFIYDQLKEIKKKIKTDANHWIENNKDSIGLIKKNKPLITTLLYKEDGVNYWNYYDSLICKNSMSQEKVISISQKDNFPTYFIKYEFQNSKVSYPSSLEFSYSIEGDLIQILLINNVWSFDVQVLYQTNVSLIDTVLFSSNNNYVLVYNFENKIGKSLDTWDLYQKNIITPIHSILKENNRYYKIDLDLFRDSLEVKKIEHINIKDFINKYDLKESGIEISNQITYSTSYFKSGTKTLKIGNSEEFETFSEYTLQIHYLLENDTINSEEIPNISPSNEHEYLTRIKKILNRNRPEEAFDENGLKKGIYPDYSIVYRSKTDQLFIYSNLFKSIYMGSEEDENWNKPFSEEEITNNPNPTRALTNYSFYGSEIHNVVILK